MALGTLTLSVTAGVQGRPFAAKINGLTTGLVHVVGGGSSAGSQGFSTVNGMVYSDGLPYPVSTVVLREYDPGQVVSFKDTRIDITAATRDQLQAQAVASLGVGRTLVRWRVAGNVQGDGTIVYSLYVEDDLGATVKLAIGGPSPGPIDVLLLIGDSNGRGNSVDESSVAYTSDANVITYRNDSNDFVTYAPMTRTGCIVPNTTAGSEARVGPEMAFAQSYRSANPSKPLAIVKFARAGSFQTYSAGTPVNGDATNSWDVTNGTLFSGAKTAVEAAFAKLTALGFTPRLIAIVDISGTNDASDATAAGNVQAAKIAMLAAWRTSTAFSASTMFIVQRQKSDSPQANITTVRVAQEAVANAAADTFVVVTDGFGTNPSDLTHFNLAGLIQCGQAHYNTYASRMNQRVLALKSKMALYFDAAQSDAMAVSVANVTAISDQVANKTLAQATGANQPTLAAAAINGVQALDFNGTSAEIKLTATNGLGSGAREFFAIVKSRTLAADTSSRTFFERGGGSSATDFRLSRAVVGGVSRFRFQSGAAGGLNYSVPDTQVVAEGGAHVIQARFDPSVTANGTLYISVDGAAEQSAAMLAAQSVTDGNMTLGSGILSQYFDGQIRLVGECSALLTAPERAALLADLRAEAGV